MSQPMDVVLDPCQGAQPLPSKPTVMNGERKKKAPKVNCVSIDRFQKHVQALEALEIATHSNQATTSLVVVALELCQGALAMVDVAPEPCQGAQPSSCKLATVTKERKNKAPKAQQRESKNFVRIVSVDRLQHVQGLKIAMHTGQGAPLSADVPREPCQGATLKKAPKAPKEVQPTKQDLNVVEGSGALKAKKSGQLKEVNKRKAKANAKEKEGTAVPEQHNVKKLKKMKVVGVREVAFEQKITIDEVKVKNKRKGHTGKVSLEKGSKDKIVAKRDGMKKKAKKHVEKGLEDKGPTDKALALVGSSKRPTLQVKRAKKLVISCTTSTNMFKLISLLLLQHEIKVGMLTAKGEEDKNNGGSDDSGDEETGLAKMRSLVAGPIIFVDSELLGILGSIFETKGKPHD
ncbi:hypothetical protein L7F22_013663 [Adiantum nelumboides]|nr:hypothetical protein [Adiantum nelumboides]